MTPRTTRTTALLAAASGLLALALLPPRHPRRDTPPPAAIAPTALRTAPPATPHTAADTFDPRPAGAAALRQRRQAHATARAFLHAFLDYEHGARDRSAARTFVRTATPALAAQLATSLPRRPAAHAWPARAGLRSLHVIGPATGRMKALATLRRGRRTEVLELAMRRRRGAWRVAALG